MNKSALNAVGVKFNRLHNDFLSNLNAYAISLPDEGTLEELQG